MHRALAVAPLAVAALASAALVLTPVPAEAASHTSGTGILPPCHGFECHDGTCIPAGLVNDPEADCPPRRTK
jgi:hypothetical protein